MPRHQRSTVAAAVMLFLKVVQRSTVRICLPGGSTQGGGWIDLRHFPRSRSSDQREKVGHLRSKRGTKGGLLPDI